jgi:hypothetical protein
LDIVAVALGDGGAGVGVLVGEEDQEFLAAVAVDALAGLVRRRAPTRRSAVNTARSAVVHPSRTLDRRRWRSDGCRTGSEGGPSQRHGGLAMRTKFRFMKLAMTASALMALAIDLGAARKFS